MAWMRTHLRSEPMSWVGLLALCRNHPKSIYVGSTDNFEARVMQHENSGYSGTIYYNATRNMYWAENRLLEARQPRRYRYRNLHQESNSPNRPGCVYLICGRRCREGQLVAQRTSRESLRELCHEDGAIYVGSTYRDRRQARVREHEKSGFSGTFYYADTDNMMTEEDRLLRESPHGYLYNIQGESNRQGRGGYVYLIKGWRNSSRRGYLEVKRKTLRVLRGLCLKPKAIYIGSMKREVLDVRVRAYEESGFSGTFYFAEIRNMKEAENDLLGIRPNGYKYNTQDSSNKRERPGYVFLIEGRRYV